MRELNVNEMDAVNGGVVPVYFVAIGFDIGLNLALGAFALGAGVFDD